MKRVVLWTVVLVFLGIGVAVVVPASRYRILGYVRNERLYDGRPIGYWLAALKNHDPEARREAALVLGDAEVVSAFSHDDTACRQVLGGLIETLGDADGFVRKCAATSLLAYPRETAVPDDSATVARLVAGLRDDEAAVRRAAARSLWQAGKTAGHGEGVVRLIDALADKDDFVREYAARTLGRIGPDAKPAVPALLERLAKDEERDVREHAAKSLGLIGAGAIGPLLEITVKALVKGLHDEAADVRENSARALGQLGARETVDELRKTLKDAQPRVRAAADESLKLLDKLID